MDLCSHIKHTWGGEPAYFAGLSVYPLFSALVEPSGYLTLAEALAEGSVSILEKSASGVVSQVRIANHGKEKVLILEGEEILGAKQNRTVNLTILLAEMSERDVPVTCVEAGRWAYQSEEFHVSGECHFARARGKKQQAVTFSMRSRGERAADQSEVWNDIEEKMAAMKVSSPTSAMREVFETHALDLHAYVQAIPALDGQTGAVFAIGPDLAGFDIFDSAATWRKMHARLLRSYAIDALESKSKEGKPALPESMPKPLLDGLATCEQSQHDALGLGMDLRFTGPGFHGASLAWNGRILHASGFWDGNGNRQPDQKNGQIARSSLRRTLKR